MYVSHTQEIQGPTLYFCWLLATGSLKPSEKERATKREKQFKHFTHRAKTAVKPETRDSREKQFHSRGGLGDYVIIE